MNYLVISYDDDQQQTFCDWTVAQNESEARTQISELRDYAVTICAITPEELRSMARALDEATEDTIAGQLKEIAQESGLEEEAFQTDEAAPGWHHTAAGLIYKSEPKTHCPCGNLDCAVCGGNAEWKPGDPYVR